MHTDFSYMIRSTKYRDCLFLFNDNFEDRNCRYPGGGSAKIRPYAFNKPCRAIGISTGWSIKEGGFKDLNDNVKQAIWSCFEHINLVLSQNPNINRVLFPCDVNDSNKIGFSIFSPSHTVADYINEKISYIPKRLQNMSISKKAIIFCEDIIERERQCKKRVGWTDTEIQTLNNKRTRI